MLNHAVRPRIGSLPVLALAALVSLSLSLFAFPAFAVSIGSTYSGLTLDDLVNGGADLFSGNEQLIFTNFDVSITNGSQDLTEYQIRDLGRGFRIQHRLGKQAEPTNIVLSYDVTTSSQSLVLHAMRLSSSKWSRHGGNNSVSVEAYDDGDLILDEERKGSGRRLKGKYWAFSDITSSASIVESISIDTSKKGFKWHLRRRYKTKKIDPGSVVPEPNTALLLGGGMVALASYAQRRRRDR